MTTEWYDAGMFLSGLLVLLLAAVVVAAVLGLRSLRAFVRALWPH